MSRRPKLSGVKVRRLLEAVSGGMTLRQAAKRFGCSVGTAHKIVKGTYIQPPEHNKHKELKWAVPDKSYGYDAKRGEWRVKTRHPRRSDTSMAPRTRQHLERAARRTIRQHKQHHGDRMRRLAAVRDLSRRMQPWSPAMAEVIRRYQIADELSLERRMEILKQWQAGGIRKVSLGNRQAIEDWEQMRSMSPIPIEPDELSGEDMEAWTDEMFRSDYYASYHKERRRRAALTLEERQEEDHERLKSECQELKAQLDAQIQQHKAMQQRFREA